MRSRDLVCVAQAGNPEEHGAPLRRAPPPPVRDVWRSPVPPSRQDARYGSAAATNAENPRIPQACRRMSRGVGGFTFIDYAPLQRRSGQICAGIWLGARPFYSMLMFVSGENPPRVSAPMVVATPSATGPVSPFDCRRFPRFLYISTLKSIYPWTIWQLSVTLKNYLTRKA